MIKPDLKQIILDYLKAKRIELDSRKVTIGALLMLKEIEKDIKEILSRKY